MSDADTQDSVQADTPSGEEAPTGGYTAAPDPHEVKAGSDTSAEKDPDHWVTGDEPMTGPQASYLETLAQNAGEQVPSGLTKKQAHDEIERLQGRGGTPDPSNQERPTTEWVTGDEPMTGAQASYLKTLSDQASEEFDENLTKAEASRRIAELQQRTGRGQS